MKGLLSRILGLISDSPRKPRGLNEIRKYGHNLELIRASDDLPAYLIAHGIIVGGEKKSEIKTAVKINGSDAEFTTNVGQLPDILLGSAITHVLNHKFVGKFVYFEAEQASTLDLVYVSRQPTDRLDRKGFESELETHAQVKMIVTPILSASFAYGHPSPELDFAKIMEVAQDIVDSHLDLQFRARDRYPSVQVVPASRFVPEGDS